jgi:hypothetical protein
VIEIVARHQGAEGSDEETVLVGVVSASYPAPPAIANAYINSTNLKSSAPKVRGCVLNQIAAKHANGQQYGAAPGPYNEAAIQADVVTFWPSCGGGTPAP